MMGNFSKPNKRKGITIPLVSLTAMALFMGCNNEMEDGDPGGVITLLKCMSTVGTAPINNEFSNPVKVTITGYTGHAMEPFITRDNSYLFFNSLNDGVDTSLHYASRVNADTFTYYLEKIHVTLSLGFRYRFLYYLEAVNSDYINRWDHRYGIVESVSYNF